MRATTNKAIVFGLAGLVPYFVLILAIAEIIRPLAKTIEEARAQFDTTRDLGIIQITTTWIIVGVYILWAYLSDVVPKQKRRLWTALLIFGNIFVIPVFWYYYFFNPARTKLS